MPTLSHSGVQDWVCKRRFWWAYVVGLELIEPPLPMLQGRIASNILDQIHTTGTYKKSIFEQFRKEDELPIWALKMEGLFDSYIPIYGEMRGKTQARFQWFEDGYPQVKGFLDLVIYDDHISYEYKYTARPESYTKFVIQDQFSTYFLGRPDLQRITLRLIRVPELRLGKREPTKEYIERVREDFTRRPGYYIKDENFWRTEFDLNATKEKMRRVANEISQFCGERNKMLAFYQANSPGTCYLPQPCKFLTICTSNDTVSENVYKRRNKEEPSDIQWLDEKEGQNG